MCDKHSVAFYAVTSRGPCCHFFANLHLHAYSPVVGACQCLLLSFWLVNRYKFCWVSHDYSAQPCWLLYNACGQYAGATSCTLSSMSGQPISTSYHHDM